MLGQARIAVAVLEAREHLVSVQKQDEPHALANPEPAPARLLTAAEVAERLGFKPGYVYELARAGKIKSRQEGKYIRFTEAAVSEYISGVDTRISNVLILNHDTRRTQKKQARLGAVTSGASRAARRAYDDGQPLGARVREDT